MGPLTGGHNSTVVEIISPATVVGLRPISLVTNSVVEHGVVTRTIFGSEDHVVALSSSQGGRSIPVDPSHRGVDTAGGA